ncbi:hypothetical protein ACFW3O_08500, partial [Streptomyces sp. NPDC058829]
MALTVPKNSTTRASTALVLTALLAAGCAQGADDTSTPAGSSPTATPHGYVEGAKESAAPHTPLLVG